MNDLASVEQWLDWEYEVVGDVERWQLRTDTHRKFVELSASDSGFEVRAWTVRAVDGAKRKSHKLSGEAPTHAAARTMVRTAMDSL